MWFTQALGTAVLIDVIDARGVQHFYEAGAKPAQSIGRGHVTESLLTLYLLIALLTPCVWIRFRSFWVSVHAKSVYAWNMVVRRFTGVLRKSWECDEFLIGVYCNGTCRQILFHYEVNVLFNRKYLCLFV